MGPGTITADLASRLTAGSVLGIDNAATAVAATEQLARDRRLANLMVITGDVYALDLPDDQFDVVHAHQVLQHLSDPVAALREMRRVCTPEGIVAARDADYSAMTWFPDHPQLTRWLELYGDVARGNGGEPDAGRRLRGWAMQAGFSCGRLLGFGLVLRRGGGSGLVVHDLGGPAGAASAFGRRAIQLGLTTGEELAALARGWREWSITPGAWFAVLHGEVICRISTT